MRNKTGQWVIVIFDALLAVLSALLLAGNVAEAQRPGPDVTASDTLVSRAACGVDVLALISPLCASVAVGSGKRLAGLFQRAVFWSLLVRTAFVFMEGTLPSEGGVGGILLLFAFLFFLVLTGLALVSAAYIQGPEQPRA